LSSKNLENSIVFIGKIRENLNFLITTVKNYTEVILMHLTPHRMPINFENSPAGGVILRLCPEHQTEKVGA